MTDSNYTHILAIVDRSGSMGLGDIVSTMTEALNEYFNGQAAVKGTALVDYVQFDTEYDKVYEDKPVSEAKAVIKPRGGTALLDAIGRGATELGEKLAKLPEARRPGKVQVVVVTDGHENSSREWDAARVKNLIKQQESKYNWDFVFLGANIDAVSVGRLFGFKEQSSLTFDINSAVASAATMDSLSSYTTSYRGGHAKGFSKEDREKALQNA